MNYLKVYLENKPPHLSIIRSLEIPFYLKYQPFKPPILDFGSGDGFFLKTLLKNQDKTKQVFSIEPNQLAAEKAKNQKIYQKVVSEIKFPLPFKNNSFSTIIANCVFEHVINLRSVTKELFRILKPNGLLLTTVATNQFPQHLLFKPIPGYRRFFNKISHHHNLLSVKNWKQLFRKSGFEIKRVIPYLNNQRLMSVFDFSHWLGVPYLFLHKITGHWNSNAFSPMNNIWYWLIKKMSVKNQKQNSKTAPYLFLALKKPKR